VSAAPDWLLGVWRRESMRYADGRQDLTTRVYWAQTRSLFVDIRVPARRSLPSHCAGWSDFSLPRLRGLAAQQGFAGHVRMRGKICTWIREIDYWPASGRPDRGRLSLEGDVLTEEGEASSAIGIGYREVYRRQRGGGKRLALRLLEHHGAGSDAADMRGAILVVIGDLFLLARPRPAPLPTGSTLPKLVAKAGRDRRHLQAMLDCEISLGRLGPARRPWRIELSTLPFREGQRLFERATATVQSQARLLTLASSAGESCWEIDDCSFEPGELTVLFGR
jgi:hypothetical protein